jgi:hypothetical protein
MELAITNPLLLVVSQVVWDLWWTSGTRAGFLRVLRFPLLLLITRND